MAIKIEKLYLELTEKCQLSCSFCPCGKTGAFRGELDFFGITKLFDDPDLIFEKCYLHVLGEPLLYSKFLELASFLESKSQPWHLVTNGLMLHHYLDQLQGLKYLKQIDVSFHGLKNNFGDGPYQTIRQKVLACSEKLIDANPSLFFNYRFWRQDDVLTPQDHEEILQIFSFWQQHYQNDYKFELQHRSLKIIDRVYIHFERQYSWPDKKNEVVRENGYCPAPVTMLGILANGEVVPCCLDYLGSMSLGNIKNDSLKNILKNPRLLQMREAFKMGTIIEETCKRCTFIERFGPVKKK